MREESKRYLGPNDSLNLNLGEFLKYLEQVNRSPATRDSYERDLKRFLTWVRMRGIQRLEKVSPQDISDYLEYLRTPLPFYRKTLISKFMNVSKRKRNKENSLTLPKGLSVTSRKRHLSTLKNFFGFLCEKYPKRHWWQRGFKRNPVLKRLHSIKVKDEDFDHTPILREEHWERIWETPLKERDRLFLALMYFGGLRISEVRVLRYHQFHFQTNVLEFMRKGGKRHQLFLQDNGVCGLLWQRLAMGKSENSYVFSDKFLRGPLGRRGAYKRAKRIFKKAGLPTNLSPHSLRKACATRLYHQTKDLLFVRDYLGHSDAKVTQTYIETQGQSIEVALDSNNENNSRPSPIPSLTHQTIGTSSSLGLQ